MMPVNCKVALLLCFGINLRVSRLVRVCICTFQMFQLFFNNLSNLIFRPMQHRECFGEIVCQTAAFEKIVQFVNSTDVVGVQQEAKTF